MSKIYLAIGSNMHRHHSFTRAKVYLKDFLSDIEYSSVYESVPLHAIGPNFYNAVICGNTDLSLAEIYTRTKQIEKEIGRADWVDKEGKIHSIRCLDIDILLYDSVVCNTEKLELPRSDIYKYEFVAVPLAEIAPTLVPVTFDKSMYDIAKAVDSNLLKKIDNFDLADI